MVDPLITIGIDLINNSLSNELRQIQIVLCPFNGQIFLVLAFDEPKEHARKVRSQNFLNEVTILLKVHLFNLNFMKLLIFSLSVLLMALFSPHFCVNAISQQKQLLIHQLLLFNSLLFLVNHLIFIIILPNKKWFLYVYYFLYFKEINQVR